MLSIPRTRKYSRIAFLTQSLTTQPPAPFSALLTWPLSSSRIVSSTAATSTS